MKRAELHDELQELAASIDEHVSEWDAQKAIRELVNRLAIEGLEDGAGRDSRPPKTRYELRLTVHGNTHDEIERELLSATRGGYLLDSDYYTRDEFKTIGGRTTSELVHLNPEQTPERYSEELEAWSIVRRDRRSS